MTLKQEILATLAEHPGLTDREITDRLRGEGSPQQPVNQACRQLFGAGSILRREGEDDLLRNWLAPHPPSCEELVSGNGSSARLANAGFVAAGDWVLEDDGIAFRLDRHADSTNCLYAFVLDGTVAYVGKTLMALRARMYGYRKPGPTQSTNRRNHAKIKAALAVGKCVQIWVLADSGRFSYAGFHLNLAAGLEDSIIAQLRPDWNG